MSNTSENTQLLGNDDSLSEKSVYKNDNTTTEDELFVSAVTDLTLGNEGSADDPLISNLSESGTAPGQLPLDIIPLNEDTISESIDGGSNHTNEITLNGISELASPDSDPLVPEMLSPEKTNKLEYLLEQASSQTGIQMENGSQINSVHSQQEPVILKEEKIYPDNKLFNGSEVGSSQFQQIGFISSTTKQLNENHQDQFIEISVTEACKVGDGMSAYVTYKIETKTNIGLFRKRSFSVNRRFSDFLGLHEKYVEKYLRTGRIIPPAPEKNAIATTKVKMSSNQSEQNSSSSEFVERRRAALERYLKRIISHPVLRLDPDFRDFLETDGDLPKATSTSALSGAGVKRLFNKFGVAVNKMAYKMDENEPWFEEKLILVENIYGQLSKLHNATESLVLNRKELATNTSQFAKSAAVLSNCEEHTGLARALAQLADVEEKVEAVYNDQANLDFSIFSELLKDYICLLGAVKDIFHERVKVYQNWQHALMMLNKKREAKERFKIACQNEKAISATNEEVEWTAKAERCEEEFQRISEVIKTEYEQFEQNRINEFKTVIVSYLESLVKHQEHLMKHWEAFLPEAKAIV